MTKTIFFGPFIGEFGWEITYWHGWVRKMCRTKYKDYHKIACSFPGHHVFYSDTNEFRPLPKKLTKKKILSKTVITDCWINGFPMPNHPYHTDNFYELVKEAIEDLKKGLPKDTEFIYPWNVTQEDTFYGVKFPENPNSNDDIKTTRIPPKIQLFEKIEASEKAKKLLLKKVNEHQKLITIFPRHVKTRRLDKNWAEENYRKLIDLLQKEFPYLKIAVVGIPGSAYFSDQVPKDCIDLINVEDKYRMDYETAALNQSVLTIGSVSGPIFLALLTKCPALTWSYPMPYKKLRKEENPLKTYLLFYPTMQPTHNEIFKYAKWMLNKRPFFKRPWLLEIKRISKVLPYLLAPEFIVNSKLAAKIKKKLLNLLNL